MPSKSFLPDDYVEERLDLRANIMSGVLFVIVMLGVIGAFFVTNQKWQTIRTAQAEVAQKYEEAGRQIYELTELEEQKKSMLSKAEMASSLVERVPRSILLAEVINRMPDQLSILEFDLTSEKVRQLINRSFDRFEIVLREEKHAQMLQRNLINNQHQNSE